ncbi:5'-nucleotidase /3'-nucleotidase /exopolyphosphatase [Pseudooceanicola antarcticus]|uniref:5'-nucleotidase SurE n=1 Tax=Pseudooceanicola antarcticus TaxID=1247613 RepID=A0A285J1R2_9RHOB|nr:5'/3'-nucleotidase SurE [Pseudooceanicola antarcticus]PJE29814.1 5'/3'-nucleotidase SurE [Pseudooceanicola antarcticus]SNY54260.1 5'-nucleotidase /3'-nucleotidase /exopolyphosphatase [Pseudooceanicola antarcticus]
MRILITNDDGINAPGLQTLTAIASELAGPTGEVWTVAPAFEQSGVAHCISYAHPTMIAKLGERRYAAEGSPADCVLAGVHDVLAGKPIDLVLSGVNRGNNSGENAMYSGTLGGAMEAALQGLTAIALSQYYGPGNVDLEDPFEAAAAHGADVVRRLLALHKPATAGYNTFYNVNFPATPAAGVKGLRVVPQGLRPDTSFSVTPQTSPSGRRFLWAQGGNQHGQVPEGTDIAANQAGFISVTPMRADLTAHDLLDTLKGLE